jgi:hypothetical protein
MFALVSTVGTHNIEVHVPIRGDTDGIYPVDAWVADEDGSVGCERVVHADTILLDLAVVNCAVALVMRGHQDD